MLLELQKAEKQMAAKPIVDYFQRVCDATIMHETSHLRALKRQYVGIGSELTPNHISLILRPIREDNGTCYSIRTANETKNPKTLR